LEEVVHRANFARSEGLMLFTTMGIDRMSQKRKHRRGSCLPIWIDLEITWRIELMNAAILLLTSAWMAGADAAPPAQPPAPAPAHGVASNGGACMNGGCGTVSNCETCEGEHSKPGLLSKLKGKLFGKHKKEEEAEEPHGPVATVAKPIALTYSGQVFYPQNCTTCERERINLLGKLRGKFSKGEATTTAGCDTCSSATPVAPAPPAHPAPAAPVHPAPAVHPVPVESAPKAMPSTIQPTPSTIILPKTPEAPKVEPKVEPKKMPEQIGSQNTLPIIITPTSNKSPIQINRDNPF
jgi:hypothetical protein